jgi:hypothetical protein
MPKKQTSSSPAPSPAADYSHEDEAATSYRVLHHDSKSNFDLQIADYCTWAIYRKWSLADPRSFQFIVPVVQKEWDFFQAETTTYY